MSFENMEDLSRSVMKSHHLPPLCLQSSAQLLSFGESSSLNPVRLPSLDLGWSCGPISRAGLPLNTKNTAFLSFPLSASALSAFPMSGLNKSVSIMGLNGGGGGGFTALRLHQGSSCARRVHTCSL